MVDAWIRKCRCSRSDKLQLRQPVLIYYYQRLYLDLKFNAFLASPAFKTPSKPVHPRISSADHASYQILTILIFVII